jgi:hypothetical protein
VEYRRYTITNNRYPTTTTKYKVTINTEDICEASSITDSIVVNVYASVNVSTDKIIYRGTSTILTASGCSSYLWSTGETTSSITVSPTQNTIYKVTGYIGNILSTEDISVNVVDTLNSAIISNGIQQYYFLTQLIIIV